MLEPCVKINIKIYTDVCDIIRIRRKYFIACYNKSDNYIFESFIECIKYHMVLCPHNINCLEKNTCIYSHDDEIINRSIIKVPNNLCEQMILIIIAIIKSYNSNYFTEKEMKTFKIFYDEIIDMNHSDAFEKLNTGPKIDYIYNMQTQMTNVKSCDIILPKEHYKIHDASDIANDINNISIKQPVIKQTDYNDYIEQDESKKWKNSFNPYIPPYTPSNPLIPSKPLIQTNPVIPYNKNPAFNPHAPPQKIDTFRYINHNNKYSAPTASVTSMKSVKSNENMFVKNSVTSMSNNNRYAILESNIIDNNNVIDNVNDNRYVTPKTSPKISPKTSPKPSPNISPKTIPKTNISPKASPKKKRFTMDEKDK
jgi:hypothetical protein